ncbi:hypothetical protein [Candidatus Mesenet endosymbiont of Phosphuga atrata]
MNPIEHYWRTIKSWLRSKIQQHDNFLLLVGNAIIEVYRLF